MKRAYDEIMDRIQVTDEMHERILASLQTADLKKTGSKRRGPASGRISAYKKYLSAAACILILAAGAVLLLNLFRAKKGEEPPLLQNPVSDIEEVGSAEELSRQTGFEVEELSSLPFEVTETTYTVYWQTLAQIRYTGEGQSAVYRKSSGSGDNSGDYNVYDTVAQKEIRSKQVTLKGNGGTYSLALWTDGEYAYSLRFDSGVSEEALLQIITGVN